MQKLFRLNTLAIALLVSVAAATAAESEIAWQSNLETGMKLAQQTNRFVLIHFYSTHCPPCRALEKDVFAQPGLPAALEAQFVPVKINVDQQPVIASKYGIDRWPTDVIVTPDDHQIAKLGCPHNPNAYLAQLNRSISTNPAAIAYRPIRKSTPAIAPTFNTPATIATDSLAGSDAVCFAAKPGQACNVVQVAYPEFETGAPLAKSSPAPTANPTLPPPSIQPYQYHDALATDMAPRTGAAAPAIANSPNAYQTPIGAPPTSVAPITSTPVQAAPVGHPAGPFAATPVTQATVGPTSPVGAQTPPNVGGSAELSKPFAASGLSAPLLNGLDGFCPVTLSEKKAWVPGNPRFGAIHLGQVFLFVSEVEQRKFLDNPNKYCPALGGNDVVAALDGGQNVRGYREFGCFCDGRVYLFANKANYQQFMTNRERYHNEVLQAETARLPLR